MFILNNSVQHAVRNKKKKKIKITKIKINSEEIINKMSLINSAKYVHVALNNLVTVKFLILFIFLN